MELEICYFTVYMIEACILLQYTSCIFQSKYTKSIQAFSAIGFYTILFFTSHLNNFAINTLFFFTANFVFISWMYQTNWCTALFHASVTTAIMNLSELTIYNVISYFLPDFFSDITYFRNLILLAAISKTIYFFILYAISRIFRNRKMPELPHKKSSFSLACVPLATIFTMMTFLLISTRAELPHYLDWMIAISGFFMLLVNLFIFSFHFYVQKKNKDYTEMQLLLQREHDSTEYYKLLLQQSENQRVLIHDLKKHLQSLALLNQNKEHQKIASYIDHIIHLPELQNRYHFSEHELLNLILNQYKTQCENKNICFQTDIRTSTVDFLSDNDLTALFCNLLDNAVESASLMPESFIELNVSRRTNTPFTVLTMSNSCRRNPFTENHKLYTKKEDPQHHGYGLKSIRRIIDKYNGELQMYYDEETISFHTILTLKCEKGL